MFYNSALRIYATREVIVFKRKRSAMLYSIVFIQRYRVSNTHQIATLYICDN